MGRGGGGRDRPSVSYGPPRFVEKEQQQQQQHRKSSGWGIAPPSRHLWVGNLSSHVTERMLSEQFLRFGDLEKIGYVPGRSYAFVDYRKVEDAVIAMRGLQGSNLAGMLIRIEFAKGVSLEKFPVLLFPFVFVLVRCWIRLQGLQWTMITHNIMMKCLLLNGEEIQDYTILVPKNLLINLGGIAKLGNLVSFEPDQNLETFQRGRNLEGPGEFRISSPLMGYGGDNPIRPGPGLGHDLGGNAEHFRFQELNSGRRMSEELYERCRSSPSIERGATWRHDIPPFERPRRPPSFDEPWGAENSSFPSAKKLKSDQFPDKELPEYPFSDFGQEKFDHAMPKFFPGEAENNAFNRNFHSDPLARKGVPDFPRNPLRRFVEGDDSWRSFDGFDAGPSPSMPFSSAKLERVNNEPQQPPLKEVWKWEGTIAKGGSPVCRARCFPVGKVLDFTLPEFLNCTARTGLDMLTKHYYQASNTWVVFFVPKRMPTSHSTTSSCII
uniref:RRM domain-containing protein n=1 Tax=Ananas comosus var. bracteatus TaxID=296719 RepID=A0A6V7Q8T7_ANACO|nr:unnamed protein product [Ananas comosus var. bracteatus]